MNLTGSSINTLITSARESSTLVIPAILIEKIVEAIDNAGYIEQAQCVFEIMAIPKACIYLG